jgi:hypothetical protein
VTDSRLANLEAVRSRADGFLRDLRRTALELSLNSALDTLDAMGSELSSTNVDHVFAVLDVLKTLSVARSASGRIHSLYLHRYGPIGDFTRRFRAVAATAPQRVRVTRYGYLSDAKLDAIVRIASGSAVRVPPRSSRGGAAEGLHVRFILSNTYSSSCTMEG